MKTLTFNSPFSIISFHNRNPKSQTKPQTQQFSFKPESEQTIVKLIDRIKTDVAVGYDNINAKLLKESKTVIEADPEKNEPEINWEEKLKEREDMMLKEEAERKEREEKEKKLNRSYELL